MSPFGSAMRIALAAEAVAPRKVSRLVFYAEKRT